MAGNGEVLEGFICPICMNDFKTPSHLTKHFEKVHNDDPEILKSLKDLFGKAKEKILKQEDISGTFSNAISERKSLEINWGPQETGTITSHTKYFKDVRNARLERYAYETNKLLIRLDKLLNNLPSDPIERKAHERTIVPWIDEKDVKLCPNCAKSFHLARRKHHCRLCGAVMCHNCTVFLSLVEARKMTSHVSVQDDSALSSKSERVFPERIVRVGVGLTKLARSPSNGSLNSVLSLVNDPISGDQHFRVCNHCINLLDAREMQKARQFDKPIVCEFYEKMRGYMNEASQHSAMYKKMWESIKEGETTYDLEDAQALRGKLAKLGENIDATSKKILILGTKQNTAEESQAMEGQEARLYQMVRTSAMIFLKEELLILQPLPSAEEYAVLQEERRKRIEARVAYEQQLEEEQREKLKEQRKKDTWNVDSSSSVRVCQAQTVVTQSQGWGPSSNVAPIMSSSMDPIIEQMSNLRAYIKQARADCKYDEVATLESNLRELQSAYFAMKQSNSSDG
ncbi:rabenosyn-5 [Pseudomyrmex gracilis]|uniref:rabenosyn-5 n=1 Tax=Pseudomyrmex gracilis TaxID=219809 RepID=UPI000995D91A|nr:rabenosyn-5 [Pseudomyrmex gracilis]